MNTDNISLHCHLWYPEESKFLLDRLSTVFTDIINISFNKNGKHNEEIRDYAQSKFQTVNTVSVENMGNDQRGFYESQSVNEEDGKDWILYTHDKQFKDRDWVCDLVDPLLTEEAINLTNEDNDVGMIISKKKELGLVTEQDLILGKNSTPTPFEEKKAVAYSLHTLGWLRILQYNLYDNYGFINKENLDVSFAAGTMFITRKQVVDVAHGCVHVSYFDEGYKPDGKVEHAMERFYAYVSKCLEYETRSI